MFSKLVGLAAGYGLAWMLKTPQGRQAAVRFGRAALRQMGVSDNRGWYPQKKGRVRNDDGQTPDGEAQRQSVLDEVQSDGDDT